MAAAGASTSLPGLSPPAVMTDVEPGDGEPRLPARPAPLVGVRDRFFETLGARETAGRLFGPADFGVTAAPVAIVNEPFVRKFFAGRNPLGRRVRTLAAEPGGARPMA